MQHYLIPTLVLMTLGFAAASAAAAVREKQVQYKDGDVQLTGYVAWDDAVEGKRPGVLVIHEWWGLNDYTHSRAKQLAQMGYVAFAADMYGDAKSTKDPKQAGEWSNAMRSDKEKFRARVAAGLAQLKQQEQCDPERVAAIGYCFGGAAVLELAYSGADVNGVVSFHGSLPEPTAAEAKAIKAHVLICHGAADPFVAEEVAAKLRAALSAGGCDWRMVYYSGAGHSFTNPASDGKFNPGVKYDPTADRRSWADMRELFDEIFAKK